MSRELRKTRTNANEDLIEAINEAVVYCNKYYFCFYEDDNIEDAKILLALQDRAIDLMKRATYKEMDLAFPLNTDTFNATAVYEYELSTAQNVLEYICHRNHYNEDLGVFFELRTQARITLGEF